MWSNQSKKKSLEQPLLGGTENEQASESKQDNALQRIATSGVVAALSLAQQWFMRANTAGAKNQSQTLQNEADDPEKDHVDLSSAKNARK